MALHIKYSSTDKQDTRCERDHRACGMLCSVNWSTITDVSGLVFIS